MSDLNHTSNDFSSVEHAAQLIEQADALIVATGAGMGVDSGLPDRAEYVCACQRGDAYEWRHLTKLAPYQWLQSYPESNRNGR